jgi:hypothetical protein
MNKFIRKYAVKLVLYLFDKSPRWRHFMLLNANNKSFLGSSISKIRLSELAGLSGTETFALTNHPDFKSRVQKGNHDLWFPNIKYIENMIHSSKIEIIAKIENRIGALDGGY